MNDCKFASSLIRRFVKIGEIKSLINDAVDHRSFEYLSKHDPFWNETDNLKMMDNLEECRLKMNWMHDIFHEILDMIAEIEDSDEDDT